MDPIDWMAFPPLSALRALEATARTGSFTAAGRALNVTHAAIAQQVRGLEENLGYPLVAREGRALSLTEEGRRLAEAVNVGFGAIETALHELMAERSGRALSVTMTPIFAEKWLMPRLKSFWAKHPEIGISLRPEYRVVDLRRERLDLGIRFGQGRWPGVDVEYLTSARFVVVGAPVLLKGRTVLTPAELEAMPWVTEDRWAEALTWLLSQGVDIRSRSTLDLPTEELAISAARQGMGLYVASSALIEADVRDGALIVLLDAQDDNPAYYIVKPNGLQNPAARHFIRWLKASV